jgi:hypothetical protein
MEMIYLYGSFFFSIAITKSKATIHFTAMIII